MRAVITVITAAAISCSDKISRAYTYNVCNADLRKSSTESTQQLLHRNSSAATLNSVPAVCSRESRRKK